MGSLKRVPSFKYLAVIGAVVFIQFVFNGLQKSYGILYLHYLHRFNKGPAKTSLIAFTSGISVTISGPLCGLLSDRINSRVLTLRATLVGVVGWVGSAFATDVRVLFFTHGILIALTSSILLSTTLVFVNKFFIHRPMLGNGLMMSGTSLGGIVMPFVIETLMEIYGFRGALLLIAGIWLNMAVACMLLTHTKTEDTLKAMDQKQRIQTETVVAGDVDEEDETQDKILMKTLNNISESYKTETTRTYVSKNLNSRTKGERMVKCKSIKSTFIPFLNLNFLTLCCLVFLYNGAGYAIPQFFPAYADESGITSSERSNLLAIISACDFASRLTLALIGDLRHVDRNLLLFCLVLTSGAGSVLLPIYTIKATLYIYSVVFGLCGDVSMVLIGIQIKESVGEEYIGIGFGIITTAFGLSSMALSAALGSVVEISGTYATTLFTTGGMQGLAAIIFYLIGGRFRTSTCGRPIKEHNNAV